MLAGQDGSVKTMILFLEYSGFISVKYNNTVQNTNIFLE